jgi:cytidylate kinase
VASLARSAQIDVSLDPDVNAVTVDGVDVTAAIRESRVSATVSKVATNLAVRASWSAGSARWPRRAASSWRAATSRPWSRPTRRSASC